MLSKRYTKTAVFAVVAAFVLWLGLSPRSATWAYEHVLMPRVPPDMRLLNANSVAPVQLLEFSCGQHMLQGMLYKHPGSDRVVLFYAGRSSNLAKIVTPARELVRLGLSVFAFEYAGFGTTAGRPSTRALMEDGLAAYSAVVNLGYAPKDIILYGESLGTAVAAYVAQRRPAAGLVLQSGFSSLERLVKELSPFFRIYPSWMFSQLRLDSTYALKNGHPPLLLIHGDEDDVIGHQHSESLAEAAGERTKLVILKGAGHFQVHEREDWRNAMREFLATL